MHGLAVYVKEGLPFALDLSLENSADSYLKLVSAIFYQIFIFSPDDSPLKTMKNIFYFI